jgi:hypothetical protein
MQVATFRPAATAVLSATVAAVALVVPAGRAVADTGLARYRAVSAHDTTRVKTATASCPDGQVVLGTGGRIIDGDGRVALAAVVPDATLTSVTARGVALPGDPAPWSVAAAAVCGQANGSPARARSGPNVAVANCPDRKLALAGGFDLPAGTALAALVPATDNGGELVRAVPYQPDNPPVAYAICVNGLGSGTYHPSRLVTPPGRPDPSSPKTSVVPLPAYASAMTGVGGAIAGPTGGQVDGVFLDTLMPTGDLSAVEVRAVAVPSSVAARTADDDPDPAGWSLTGYGTAEVYY